MICATCGGAMLEGTHGPRCEKCGVNPIVFLPPACADENTFEQYLRRAIRSNAPECHVDMALRAQVALDGRVVFCVHPSGRDGETADFEVCNDTLSPNRDIRRG